MKAQKEQSTFEFHKRRFLYKVLKSRQMPEKNGKVRIQKDMPNA